jgi:hypothetical protein
VKAWRHRLALDPALVASLHSSGFNSLERPGGQLSFERIRGVRRSGALAPGTLARGPSAAAAPGARRGSETRLFGRTIRYPLQRMPS